MSASQNPPREPTKPAHGDLGDLALGARVRRERVWSLSMSERLARLHELCLQMGDIKGAALREDSVDSDLLGIPVQVCSLAKLKEMKQARGQTEDLADLENLPDA